MADRPGAVFSLVAVGSHLPDLHGRRRKILPERECEHRFVDQGQIKPGVAGKRLRLPLAMKRVITDDFGHGLAVFRGNRSIGKTWAGSILRPSPAAQQGRQEPTRRIIKMNARLMWSPDDRRDRPFPALLHERLRCPAARVGRPTRRGSSPAGCLHLDPDRSKNRPIRPCFLTLFSAGGADSMQKEKAESPGVPRRMGQPAMMTTFEISARPSHRTPRSDSRAEEGRRQGIRKT